jgi:hypothetical protein
MRFSTLSTILREISERFGPRRQTRFMEETPLTQGAIPAMGGVAGPASQRLNGTPNAEDGPREDL